MNQKSDPELVLFQKLKKQYDRLCTIVAACNREIGYIKAKKPGLSREQRKTEIKNQERIKDKTKEEIKELLPNFLKSESIINERLKWTICSNDECNTVSTTDDTICHECGSETEPYLIK